MLYYDRIGIGDEIDPTKSNKSRDCMICHYFLFNHEFKFQDSLCNGNLLKIRGYILKILF